MQYLNASHRSIKSFYALTIYTILSFYEYMGKFLNLAKEHIQKLGYKVLQPIKDKNEFAIGYYAEYKNKTLIMIAFEKFHFILKQGACKSIDIEIINTAIENNCNLLIYTHEPTHQHEPECYIISPEKIDYWAKTNKVNIEVFGKWDFCEKRKKYVNVPLSQLDMKNIRADRSRQMYDGENFWNTYLRPIGYIFIGNQHNDPIFKEIFGYCPDFVNFKTHIIIEEGKHPKQIEKERNELAKSHGFKIFFISKDIDFYKKHPEAVDVVLKVIKYL